ncbi:MAG: RtcB family protein [Polyangiaceae bacterium]|nr:RtcB family protein [Polyangiaceae bacterium]
MSLLDETNWKQTAKRDPRGFYLLETRDTSDVPIRLFLTESLFRDLEPGIYKQLVNATKFPGAKLVVVTPDVHVGYGVPVGSVILTDREAGAIAMGPVGFDIGCGMVCAKSQVDADRATPDRKLAFHQEIFKRVELGAGGQGQQRVSDLEFQDIVRGGAAYFADKGDRALARFATERDRIPVEDGWDVPWGGPGSPERGRSQLGTLGGGNHFIELQRCEETGKLHVQVHTGSRGFGHGLATNYFAMAKDEHPERGSDLDLGYFTPESKHHREYQNAVAAGGNYAIVNRMLLVEAVAEAFQKVFKEDLTLVYEISHNLVQAETHPEFGEVWVHRKGATRAFPAHHPSLIGTPWEASGHPVLIPGSNRDFSYILRPEAGAEASAYSVNHGAGRRLSRGEANRVLSQEKVNEQYRRDRILVNLDGEVPLDESNACYKSCAEVVEAVVGAGLATVECTLWPLGSIKGNDGVVRKAKRDRRHLEKDRDRARRDERKLRGR